MQELKMWNHWWFIQGHCKIHCSVYQELQVHQVILTTKVQTMLMIDSWKGKGCSYRGLSTSLKNKYDLG